MKQLSRALWLAPILFAVTACEAPITTSSQDRPSSTAGGIRYLGGDGSSVEKAIVIKGAHGETDGIQSEYDWIAKNRPGWTPTGQALLENGAKFYDLLTIQKAGREEEIYFDITAYFGNL